MLGYVVQMRDPNCLWIDKPKYQDNVVKYLPETPSNVIPETVT